MSICVHTFQRCLLESIIYYKKMKFGLFLIHKFVFYFYGYNIITLSVATINRERYSHLNLKHNFKVLYTFTTLFNTLNNVCLNLNK